MKKRIIIFILIIVFNVACENRVQPSEKTTTEEVKEVGSNLVNSYLDKKAFDVYVEEDDYKLSLYEPKAGCYLGAYVLSNKKLSFDMKEFEKKTEKAHSLYVYNMKLGDSFPSNWILSCISEMKTPYVIIKPQNSQNPFDTQYLEKIAKEFGEFYVPIFVDFYPIEKNKNYNPEEYKKFVKQARFIMRKYASNVAFVWSVSDNEVFDSNKYYPGDENCDWVGISIFKPIYSSSKVYEIDLYKPIEYLYYTYQRKKPIIISQLAISHFSTINNVYYTKEASEQIRNLYKNIEERYPRIKAINYVDFNGIERSNENKKNDNFSITENENILKSYKDAILSEGFLSQLVFFSFEDLNKEKFKSPFNAYKIENDIYISEKSVEYDLNIQQTNTLDIYKTIIDEENYFNINFVKDNTTKKVTVDEIKNEIIVH